MTEALARKQYTREDYEPFIGKSGVPNRGLLPLPNARDVDPLQFLNDLAARGHMMTPVWGYSIDAPTSPPTFSHTHWTQFFLLHDANMGMGLGGGGYAVVYGSKAPAVRRFQICQHEKELHAGANESRGWSPGHCKHCGMDMTIDSGD